MSAAASLSGRQRRALAEMGIEVWVRRSVATAAVPVAVAAPGVGATPVAIPASPEPPRAQSVSDASAPVQLECFTATGAVVLGAFANAADRRIAQDVLLAVVGMDAAVARTLFRWPLTQTADASPAAARAAFNGFVRGQTERAHARCLLLFGAPATTLFDPASSLDGCTVLRVPDAGTLRGDAAGKKALWLTISSLVHR